MNFHRITYVSLLMLAAGCQSVTETGYYWGEYSASSYLVANDPSEKNLRNHVIQLDKIVAISNKRGLKTPPGIYADLGFTHERLGESQMAGENYQLEMELYPESRIFLQRLMTVDRKESVNNEGINK